MSSSDPLSSLAKAKTTSTLRTFILRTLMMQMSQPTPPWHLRTMSSRWTSLIVPGLKSIKFLRSRLRLVKAKYWSNLWSLQYPSLVRAGTFRGKHKTYSNWKRVNSNNSPKYINMTMFSRTSSSQPTKEKSKTPNWASKRRFWPRIINKIWGYSRQN